jgi:hypothetical protein
MGARISQFAILAIPMPDHDTEYSATIPVGTVEIIVQPRLPSPAEYPEEGAQGLDADIRLSFQEGMTDTLYWTVREPPAQPFRLTDLLVGVPDGLPVYLKSDLDDQVCEIICMR